MNPIRGKIVIKTQDDFIYAAIEGAQMAVNSASGLVEQVIDEKGTGVNIGFPGTALPLPLIAALLDRDVKSIARLPEVIDIARSFIRDEHSLEAGQDAGIATLISSEIIEAVKYLGRDQGESGWKGFIEDSTYRSLGILLVDGRMPGMSIILGSAPQSKIATSITRELQSRNILSFLAAKSRGITFKRQLEEEGVSLGLERYVVPLGPDATSSIYAVNFAARVALSFGAVKKGDIDAILRYTRERIPAFVIALGELNPIKTSMVAAMMKLGFPVITDQDIEVLSYVDNYEDIVSKGIEARNIKIKIDRIDIPVNYSAAFEGERVRKEEMFVEFGGRKSLSFEFVRSKAMDEIKDGRIQLLGPDIDDIEQGKSYPLGIVVDVSGKKMQEDFEPVLERQIHRFLNYAMGVFHIGQRDMNWIRVSKEAKNKGLKVKDFGKIIYAKLHNEYASIIDKVQVLLLTDEVEINKILPEARDAYLKRDERIKNLKDDTVDTFYSCLLCTSFAPNHVCILSPERTGLCGAVSWLDAKASYEISPTGGNRPVERGECLDAVKGVWKGVNEFVYSNSNKTIDRLSLYSLMDSPMSSCGCFECVVAVMPEANGVIIVNREYTGITPIGMQFSTLAGSVGGGQQTPGFMGVAKRYITSRLFISAEGGLKRVVWMPRELKETLNPGLERRAKEIGMPELIDKIADETICTEVEELLRFLERVNHPVLSMEPLI